MNLLEILPGYQLALKTDGRDKADDWLNGLGLGPELVKAVRTCFDDSGVELAADAKPKVDPHKHSVDAWWRPNNLWKSDLESI